MKILFYEEEKRPLIWSSAVIAFFEIKPFRLWYPSIGALSARKCRGT